MRILVVSSFLSSPTLSVVGGLPLANPLHVAGGPDPGIYSAAANPARLSDLAGAQPAPKSCSVYPDNLDYLARGVGLHLCKTLVHIYGLVKGEGRTYDTGPQDAQRIAS